MDKNSHMILRDQNGNARFALRYGYDKKLNELYIFSIQRERSPSSYRLKGSGMLWDAEIESENSKQFQKQLGIHPAEFLMAEFIYRNRKKVRNGVKLFFSIYKGQPLTTIYKPLIDRFFKRRPTIYSGDISQLFELNFDKKRVKEILSIP